MEQDRTDLQIAENKIFLTIDFGGDILRLRDLNEELGHRVHAIKFGQGFLLHEKWPQTLRWLRQISQPSYPLYLDLKSHQNKDQIRDDTLKVSRLGFRYMSVHASAPAESFVSAARAAGGMSIVAALSYSEGGIPDTEYRNISQANDELEAHQRIAAVMCNASQLEAAARLEGVLSIATGIRLPGADTHDHQATATPREALDRGADMLVIGRPLTGSRQPGEALDAILDNMLGR